MQYKPNQIIINKDNEVSQIVEILKQTNRQINYVDQDNYIVTAKLDYIELAEAKRNRLLKLAQKDLIKGESVQIQLDNDDWVSDTLQYLYIETFNTVYKNNHVVLKISQYFENEYIAVKDVRRFDRELIDIEREMCI